MTAEHHGKSFVSEYNWKDRRPTSNKKEKRQQAQPRKNREPPRVAQVARHLVIPPIEDVIKWGLHEDKHHIFSRPFLKDHIEDMRDWERLRGKKIHVSHLAHALLHHAAYYVSGYPSDMAAYLGQVSHISSVQQMDIYLHYSEDENFLEQWGDPYFVMRKCKKVIFFSEK